MSVLSKRIKTIPFLYSELDNYDFEHHPFPSEITSVFGQTITLFDKKGAWIPIIKLQIPGYTPYSFKWPPSINAHPVIEYAARMWAIERLQTHVSPRGALDCLKLISRIRLPKNSSATDVMEAIKNWASLVLSERANRTKKSSLTDGLRSFVTFCVEEEIWGFDESLFIVLNEYKRVKSAQLSVCMLSESTGPYTTIQMQAITEALKSDSINQTERVVVKLCQTFGLRPVQLALLREDDIWVDEGGAVIRIPSVKGKSRSRLRRAKYNFVERELPDQLYRDIQELIIENVATFNYLAQVINSWGQEKKLQVPEIPKPLFPVPASSQSVNSMLMMFEHPTLREYTFHRRSNSISKMVRCLTLKMRLCQKSDEPSNDFIKIAAYRFRYTLGTRLVLDGRSPEEVAEALDHATTDSVSHYFRYSRDVFDYVNEAHLRSKDIRSAAIQWRGKLRTRIMSDAENNEISVVNVEFRRVSPLGLCAKKTWCESQPIISCYSCNQFRPYKDGDHDSARKIIEQTRREWIDKTSGSMRAVLDNALQGVNQVLSILPRTKDKAHGS